MPLDQRCGFGLVEFPDDGFRASASGRKIHGPGIVRQRSVRPKELSGVEPGVERQNRDRKQQQTFHRGGSVTT